MPDAPPASPAYDFAMICTEAIFLERTTRMTRGETLKKSDVVRIIREQDALRLDRLPAKVAVPASETPAERVYAAYPRHVGKKTAIKAITAVLGTVDLPELLGKVTAYADAVEKWAPHERQFVPHPATWFNRGSYLDDPKEWLRGKPEVVADARTYEPTASLGSLQIQLKRIEDEMEGILYPGGAAFKTIPTGDKLTRYQTLMTQRTTIKKRIEGFGQ